VMSAIDEGPKDKVPGWDGNPVKMDRRRKLGPVARRNGMSVMGGETLAVSWDGGTSWGSIEIVRVREAAELSPTRLKIQAERLSRRLKALNPNSLSWSIRLVSL
jgi:hypothetical protein